MRRFPARKLTKADGERILWHVLFYLTGHYAAKESVDSIKDLLEEYFMSNENT
jgi:hypothetical protein